GEEPGQSTGLCRVILERKLFKLSCSSTARTMRKPTKSASVSHQMLRGRCGSWAIQANSEVSRAALRQSLASSPHEPPRATRGKIFSAGSTTGDKVGLSSENAA